MIALGDVCPQVGTPFLVRVDHIALPPSIPAGMSPWMLLAIAHGRRCGEPQRDPVTVRRHPDWPGGWQLVDGRHRVVANIMAGCADVLAVEVP